MRKGVVLAGIGLVLLLAACNNETPRDIFTENLVSYADTSEHNLGEFIFAIDQLEMKTPETGDSATDESQEIIDGISSLLATMRVTGDFLHTKEKDAMQGEMTVIASANEIPIEFIRSEGKLFLAGSSYLELLNLSDLKTDIEANQSLLEAKLTNRYLELDSDEINAVTGSAKTSGLITMSSEAANEQVKLFADYSDTLDEAGFIQEEDLVTYSYTSEELAEFTTYVEENGSETLQEQVPAMKQLIDAGFSAMTITVNPNYGNLEYKGTIDNERMTLVFSLSYNAGSSNEKVEVPSGDKLISEDEKKEIVAMSVE